MKSLLKRSRKGDAGVLTFEWIMLITLMVIGIVGGVTAVRDAVITELGDITQAVVSIDTSYRAIEPIEVVVATREADGASGSVYEDKAVFGEDRGGYYVQTEVDISNSVRNRTATNKRDKF